MFEVTKLCCTSVVVLSYPFTQILMYWVYSPEPVVSPQTLIQFSLLCYFCGNKGAWRQDHLERNQIEPSWKMDLLRPGTCGVHTRCVEIWPWGNLYTSFLPPLSHSPMVAKQLAIKCYVYTYTVHAPLLPWTTSSSMALSPINGMWRHVIVPLQVQHCYQDNMIIHNQLIYVQPL